MAGLIETTYSARQSGKTALMREWIAEQEAAGEWVAVAGKDGVRCSRCERDIDACRRSCLEASA